MDVQIERGVHDRIGDLVTIAAAKPETSLTTGWHLLVMKSEF